MAVEQQSMNNMAVTWLSFRDGYNRIGGRVTWATEEPRWVEYLSGWPVLKVRVAGRKSRSLVQSAMQIRKSSWHAHLPRERLSIPAKFKMNALDSRICLRQEGDTYAFDFTGMGSGSSSDELERRVIVLLEDLENVRRFHPDILDRLGIDIAVNFRDEGE
jgi:hypothetical protein